MGTMSIDLKGDLFWFKEFRRFDVEVPILGVRGNVEGLVRMSVMANNVKQARAHVRKEMLKIARISTNNAKVVDTDPKRNDP